jgi:hypothetical protein
MRAPRESFTFQSFCLFLGFLAGLCFFQSSPMCSCLFRGFSSGGLFLCSVPTKLEVINCSLRDSQVIPVQLYRIYLAAASAASLARCSARALAAASAAFLPIQWMRTSCLASKRDRTLFQHSGRAYGRVKLFSFECCEFRHGQHTEKENSSQKYNEKLHFTNLQDHQ